MTLADDIASDEFWRAFVTTIAGLALLLGLSLFLLEVTA